MEYYVLASGSKGNATIIASHGHVILIDMGLTKKKFLEQLSHTPYHIDDIEAVLVTHDHGDHTKGLKYVSSAPIFAGVGTYDIDEDHYLESYCQYNIAHFKITILPTSHDARNPMGFVIEDDDEKLIYMTDTGYISEKNINLMENGDYYIIESNHNVRMLLATQRTYELKLRILGDEGHLSNEDSAFYMTECIGPKTKEIVLAHLSEEANDPAVALEAYQSVFKKRGLDFHKYRIQTASQHSVICGGQLVKI